MLIALCVEYKRMCARCERRFMTIVINSHGIISLLFTTLDTSSCISFWIEEELVALLFENARESCD